MQREGSRAEEVQQCSSKTTQEQDQASEGYP